MQPDRSPGSRTFRKDDTLGMIPIHMKYNVRRETQRSRAYVYFSDRFTYCKYHAIKQLRFILLTYIVKKLR
jgi:hypothetical protein